MFNLKLQGAPTSFQNNVLISRSSKPSCPCLAHADMWLPLANSSSCPMVLRIGTEEQSGSCGGALVVIVGNTPTVGHRPPSHIVSNRLRFDLQ
jgi:hypothetical protein